MDLAKTDKIFVAGHRGMVGSAIVRRLLAAGYTNLVTRTRQELDLLDQAAVRAFFESERPAAVVLSAAKVGGIKANMSAPADFLYQNLQIQNNVIWEAHRAGVKKLLFLGSSCIYPRGCPQPMKEEYLLDGKPEPTNEGYAIAKIAGMKLCEKIHEQFGETFISCMPTNIYGPGDNLDPESSHVIPALLRRFHEAKRDNVPEVAIWGSGSSRREFLHVDDLAEAVQFLLESYDDRQFLNVGTGEDISIKELAEMIRDLVGYEGRLVFDTSKPDGMPLKRLDVSRINALGWKHRVDFADGLREAYEIFKAEAYSNDELNNNA
jgi:GDP-L-fucose synthase